MIAISRFQVDAASQTDFVSRAEAAVEHFRGCAGNTAAELVRNLDEPQLWAIVTHWENVGSYRRSFSGYEAKMVLVPLLSESIDEPGAYESPEDHGPNIPRVG